MNLDTVMKKDVVEALHKNNPFTDPVFRGLRDKNKLQHINCLSQLNHGS